MSKDSHGRKPAFKRSLVGAYIYPIGKPADNHRLFGKKRCKFIYKTLDKIHSVGSGMPRPDDRYEP